MATRLAHVFALDTTLEQFYIDVTGVVSDNLVPLATDEVFFTVTHRHLKLEERVGFEPT